MSDKKGTKKPFSFSGMAQNLLGGSNSKKEESGGEFKPGNLIRPDKLIGEGKNVFYAVKPDAVDWIDWKRFPFHSIKFKNDVNRILERNEFDINHLNDANKSALHVMVEKEDKELVISILSANAELEIFDGEGNNPLHVAAQKNSVSCAQALLGFGAEVNVRNKNGDSARHIAASISKANKKDRILYVLHAVGAERCESGKYGCAEGCSFNGTHNGAPPPFPTTDEIRPIIDFYPEIVDESKSKKGGRVLCLDGGGIKGVVLIAQLMALEKVSGKSVLECFDWIAGTSTGGILACGLAAGLPLRELMNTYFLIKDKVFGLTRPFDDSELSKILKDIVGPNRVMNELQSVKLIITGTLCDQAPVKLHLFRNYAAPSTLVAPDARSKRTPLLADHTEQILWQAARSSGAAPTYFEKFDRFMDGGLIANNPTLDVLTEIYERNLALKRVGQEDEVAEMSTVVSLGCGMSPLEELDVDLVWPDDPIEFANNFVGIVKILNILSTQATNPDNAVVDRARAWCSMINVPYYRFSPTLHQNVDLATKDDKVLATVIWETRAYMHKHYEQVERCARSLLV